MDSLVSMQALPIIVGVSIVPDDAIRTYETERGKIHTDEVRDMAINAVAIANELLAKNDLHELYLGLGKIVVTGGSFGAWLEGVLKDFLGDDRLDPGSDFMHEVKRRFILQTGAPDLVGAVMSGKL